MKYSVNWSPTTSRLIWMRTDTEVHRMKVAVSVGVWRVLYGTVCMVDVCESWNRYYRSHHAPAPTPSSAMFLKLSRISSYSCDRFTHRSNPRLFACCLKSRMTVLVWAWRWEEGLGWVKGYGCGGEDKNKTLPPTPSPSQPPPPPVL